MGSQGTVCWIIGMSASGKTTLAKEMYKLLNNRSKNWIYLDGDTVRNIFGEDLGHTVEERKINAGRISMLCKGLAENGYNVLACVLSIFPENQKENRETLQNYKEVYIRVSLNKLMERDNKSLYQSALDGAIKNVVGVDIDFPEPYMPDAIIDNDMDNINFTELAVETLNLLGLQYERGYPYSRENKLTYPYKYEYTPYEGPVLLDSYYDSRKRLLKIWERGIAKMKPYTSESAEVCDYIEKECVSETAQKGTIPTRRLFYEILSHQQKNIFAESNALIIERFIKKFELFKRIYTRYHEGVFTKAEEDYSDIFVYLLFSNILVSYILNQTDAGKRVIAFNALLKLNDTIASTAESICTPAEILLAQRAVTGELDIYKRYAKGLYDAG